jgi:hypothetical protein
MAVHDNPRIVTNGLVLHLDAANPKSYSGSGTAWTDLSGLGNNGTLTNGPTFNANNAGSIVFDGTNDYVPCTGSVTVTSATFIAWLRRNGNQIDYAGIVFSRGTNVTGMDFITSNNIGYTWNDAANTYNWLTGLVPPDLTWCMCVISVSSSSATAYLCQSTGITSATNVVSHASSTIDSIRIGFDNSSRFFNGNIALASIYNRALSAAEIRQNFNATRGRFGI